MIQDNALRMNAKGTVARVAVNTFDDEKKVAEYIRKPENLINKELIGDFDITAVNQIISEKRTIFQLRFHMDEYYACTVLYIINWPAQSGRLKTENISSKLRNVHLFTKFIP
jgi:hypothetical protein